MGVSPGFPAHAPPAGTRSVPGDSLLHSRLLERAARMSINSAAARSRRFRSSKRKPATFRPTFQRTSFRLPTVRSSLSRTSSTQVSGRRSTPVFRFPRRRLRADQGHASSRRPPPPRTLRFPRPWPRSRSSDRISIPRRRRSSIRGQRMTEVLKQPQYRPMPVQEQVAICGRRPTASWKAMAVEEYKPSRLPISTIYARRTPTCSTRSRRRRRAER